jgi:hypothetical protein
MHDIDALTACFASSFANDWPAHPARSFTGADQVRRNYTQHGRWPVLGQPGRS